MGEDENDQNALYTREFVKELLKSTFLKTTHHMTACPVSARQWHQGCFCCVAGSYRNKPTRCHAHRGLRVDEVGTLQNTLLSQTHSETPDLGLGQQ